MEAVFRRVKGILDVSVGYSGGERENPLYASVKNGTTGHAESVSISYDANVISYGHLLDVFFIVHDPTTLNK